MSARRKLSTPRKALAANPADLHTGFFEEVRAILQQARQKAYPASNFIMVEAYWNIGRRIVQEEQGGKDRADYGTHLIRNLARTLGEEFGNGVSVANLWNFKQFYLTFPAEEKLYALRRELTWTDWRLLMRVEDPQARDYYISEAAAHGWNTRQLERNIATHSYVDLVFYNYLLKCFVLLDFKTHKRKSSPGLQSVLHSKIQQRTEVHDYLFQHHPLHRQGRHSLPLLRPQREPATLRLQIPPRPPQRRGTPRRTGAPPHPLPDENVD